VGLSGGLPVSSSGSRTALASAAGARTQLYSLIALASVLATLLFAGPVLTRFPTAVLGAIVVYAAVRLIDLPGFRRLAAFRRSELLLALGAFAGVLVFDILYGVLLAVGLWGSNTQSTAVTCSLCQTSGRWVDPFERTPKTS